MQDCYAACMLDQSTPGWRRPAGVAAIAMALMGPIVAD